MNRVRAALRGTRRLWQRLGAMVRNRMLAHWVPNNRDVERRHVERMAAEAARQREDVRRRLAALEVKVRVMGRLPGETA